jgi:3-hydroxybutyryl-CoA dehydratase
VHPFHKFVHITSADVYSYAQLADDFNPIHMDGAAARALGFQGRICHGGLLTAMISGMIANAYPGAIRMEHTIQFKRAALVGQTLEFALTLDETIKKPTKTLGIIGAEIKNTAGELVATSRNVVMLPARAEREPESATIDEPREAVAVSQPH